MEHFTRSYDPCPRCQTTAALSRTPYRACLAGVIITLGILNVSHALGAEPTFYDHGNPSNAEEYMLSLINRARANPAVEGQRLAAYMRQKKITGDGAKRTPDQLEADFASYPARAPLATNAALLQAARTHGADVLRHPSLGHTGTDGSTASDRAVRAGYGSIYVGENLFGKSDFSPDDTHASFLIDPGNPELGHRHNLLNDDGDGVDSVEIGLAYDESSGGRGITIEDFGMKLPGHPMACGVIYQDNNKDGRYNAGEGVGGVRIASPASSYYTVSSASGGYSLPLDSLNTHTAAEVPQVQMISLSFTQADGNTVSQSLPIGYLKGAPPNEWYQSGYTNVAADWEIAATPAQPPIQLPSVAVSTKPAKQAFLISRTGADTSQPLAVDFELIGKKGATAGTDFIPLSGSRSIPAGRTSVQIRVQVPGGNVTPGSPKGVVVLRVKPSSTYTVSSPSKAKIQLGSN